MKKGAARKLLVIFTVVASVVIGGIVAWLWAAGFFMVDPPPKGNGSYDELTEIVGKFRQFYLTQEAGDLPEGFVQLDGSSANQNGKDTWMVYFATGSHKQVRGGTIVLMDSSGRIDGYFGHHCSGADGGWVTLPANAHAFWQPGLSYESFEDVRDAFDIAFKHQITEQAAAGDPVKPAN